MTRWKRYGHDRLYANLPDGTAVGWADVTTGDITVLRAECRDEVIAVLTKHLRDLTEPAPSARALETQTRPVLPPLTPADDLALNPPGRALRDLLDESGPGLMERVVSRLLWRPSEWDRWRKGLAGERRVGAELNRLGRHGWRVLHSIPLANKVDIDHLLIGRGGVFSINTKHHHKRAVWVGWVVACLWGSFRSFARAYRRPITTWSRGFLFLALGHLAVTVLTATDGFPLVALGELACVPLVLLAARPSRSRASTPTSIR